MNRKILAVVGFGVLVVILAAGAYTTVQLAAAPNETEGLPAGSMVFEDVITCLYSSSEW